MTQEQDLKDRLLDAQSLIDTHFSSPVLFQLFNDSITSLEASQARIEFLEKALEEECEYHGYQRWGDMLPEHQAVFEGDCPNLAKWRKEPKEKP